MAREGLTIKSVKPTSLALFVGVAWGLIGLTVALIAAVGWSIAFGETTDSFIKGMLFGMTAGLMTVILLPLIYFAIGWLIGVVYGWLFNVVAGLSGGIEFNTKE